MGKPHGVDTQEPSADAGLASNSVPMPAGLDVGARLRALREERGLSIRSLAVRSRLAVNTLSLIENGKTSPSVSTLQQLARAMDIPITAFFTIAPSRHSIVFSAAGERPRVEFAQGTLEDLGTGIAERAIEPLLITLEPDAGSGDDAIVHTGQEFVYCLAGRIIYTIADKNYTLMPGDSLLFEAHLPHRWHNPDDTPSRVLLILCPFDGRDYPARRHFVRY